MKPSFGSPVSWMRSDSIVDIALRHIVSCGFFLFSDFLNLNLRKCIEFKSTQLYRIKSSQMYTPQKGNLEVSFNDTLLSFMLRFNV